MMVQIQDTVVSLDVFSERFCCDLSVCKGACCIEGDAGAPVDLDEIALLEDSLEAVWHELSEEAQAVIDEQGVAYADQEGDMVTSIVRDKDCVFTGLDKNGCCFCTLERAYREGRTSWCKPISCSLYPIRVSDFGPYKAVNLHRWSICKAAFELGRKRDIPVYKFLREPLILKFGKDWYDELETVAAELIKQKMI